MKHLILIGCVALAACTVRRDGANVDIDPVTDRIGDWTATLVPRGDSQMRGSVTAKSAVAATGVTITITNAAGGGRHPWHVHRGTCANTGSILGGADEYPLLEVGSNGAGSAKASANLEIALSEDSQYSVNVHKSASELGVIVACGDLRR